MNQPDPYFRIAELITRFLQEKLTPSESEELKAWIAESEDNSKTWKRLTDPEYLGERLNYWQNNNTNVHWKQLRSRISGKQSRFWIMSRKSMKYAAILVSIALIYTLGAYFSGRKKKNQHDLAKAETSLTEIQIMPKGNAAQLILGNGEIIDLSDKPYKSLREADGTTLENRSNRLSYASPALGDKAGIIYNTLITPRGGEYQVRLSDGTIVWLNAASSLRYPTRYDGNERRVYLKGEAYFEVAPDAQHPFVVSSEKADIKVLGTKFNVSAYEDDLMSKTTLAEGSVAISLVDASAGTNPDVILKPGYQAVVTENTDKIDVNKVDVDAALAWKNNMLIFDRESLGDILRKLSRCYDVDVVYDADVDTKFHFTGRIQRYENISGVLQLLELTRKVRFTIKGQTLHVSRYNTDPQENT